MTGFGSATAENDYITIKAELKALNGKFLEPNIRLPRAYQSKELSLRKLLQNELERGSVSVYLNIENKQVNSSQYRINKELAKYYYEEINQLSFELGAVNHDSMVKIIELPDVLSVADADDKVDENWQLIEETCSVAIKHLKEFRLEEGMEMGKIIEKSVVEIKSLLDEILQHEAGRIVEIRERINNNLEEFVGIEKVDRSRFEQEMVYFIEKLDFAEEKGRLRNHCQYFLDSLYKDSAGKKLGFIAQEMGREINTLGAKAYHFGIQQAVVRMKEELEKVKEMVLNIL